VVAGRKHEIVKAGQICIKDTIELKCRKRPIAPRTMDCVSRAARHQRGKMPC
jgi:hypothetical protein